MKHLKTYNELNEKLADRFKDWWTRPRNQGMSDNGSPKDFYNYSLKWLLAIPLLGTNLLIEYGYKAIINIVNKYGKPLKDLVNKIKNDPVISEYLEDPNFRMQLGEEEYYFGIENDPNSIIYSRLSKILTKKEWYLFNKYIYESQKILRQDISEENK